MDKGTETASVVKPGWNPVKMVFIIVSVLAGLYFITGVLALVFPDAGIPFIWMAFPVGPQAPPMQ